MRLGGMVFGDVSTPLKWVNALKDMGYRAAYCPVDAKASATTITDYKTAAEESDIIIAEVGAWKNTLSPDAKIRNEAIEYAKTQLDLADRIGAVCCVNIAGGCGEQWDGPHPDNLTLATFHRVVEMVQGIIDSVEPRNAVYTLEPMPWVFPHTPNSYLDLVKAIDRKSFAVHLDPVNMINSPVIYLQNANFLNECFDKLGPHIVSVHVKDILLSGKLTTHLDEMRPGLGELSYKTFITRMNLLHADMPFMLEHMSEETDYRIASDFLRGVAKELDIVI